MRKKMIYLAEIGYVLWGICPTAHAAICFLPDCEKAAKTAAEDAPADVCRRKGFVSSANLACPANTAVEYCSEDQNFIRCSKAGWCLANGYTVRSCERPEYVDEQCPNLEAYYRSCKRDAGRGCQDEGFVLSCISPQKLFNGQRCPWDSSYGKCCSPKGCPEYTSLTGTYGNSGSDDGCGYICKYTCDLACPAGTTEADPGGCGGSVSNGCGNKKCYMAYKACCGEQYKYNNSNCSFPHKLAGTICGGNYSDCILDENNINCDNYVLPNTANYLKAAYTCADLSGAVNSGQSGNIVVMKSMACPGNLTLNKGQNLVGIGYYEDTNSSLYKNQLNQCSVLQLNNYLYTKGDNKISDLTLNNTPLYLQGATDIHNMNMKIASDYAYAVQGYTSTPSVMSGIINIYTPGAVALYKINATLDDVRMNLRPAGGNNRGFRQCDIVVNGTSVINMDLNGASGSGEAVLGGNLYLNDYAELNIRANSADVEAFNGDTQSTMAPEGTKVYIQSAEVVIRANITGSGTDTFVHEPYFSYVSGAQMMTRNGLYRSTGSGNGIWASSHTPSGSWSQIGGADFSSSSDFGKEMEIFNLNFFK